MHSSLVERLDLDVDNIPICLACLSFVSSALESGHPREIDRAVAEFAPILSEEGLAQPVLLALQRTKRQGVAGAEAALAEVERRGARAPIVALIVLRLAAQLSGRAAGDLRRLGFELWPPPNGAIL